MSKPPIAQLSSSLKSTGGPALRFHLHRALAIVFAVTFAMPAWALNAKGGSTPKSEQHNASKSKHSVHKRHHRFLHGADYRPPYAEIVVDDNSGQVLHETSPDSPRHPASLTKIMTLYLLFERLQAKQLDLNSRLAVSAHASAQAPTRLGLKPADTITVEDAIKGIVTRSANDAAVVIAEALAGSEQAFAETMTQKAQGLGMNNTVYVNASGLPADAQITTARDQALLGRAIQEHFPEYYRYFSLPSFQFRGMSISNHNALLRDMQGVDGIKTGYTEASGYNLVSSVRRDGRHLVAVVLGGRSTGARDSRMRQLIQQFMQQASAIRTARPILDPTSPAAAPTKHPEPVSNVAPAPFEPAAISVEHTR